MFYTLVNFFSYADAEERFKELQSKLQELNVLHQSSVDFDPTVTSSSRDSGIPIPSSSSSYCSSASESISPAKNSLELSPPENTFKFFLHPPNNNPHHVSVHLNDKSAPMSYIYDSTPRSQSHRRSVHWNDESLVQQLPSSGEDPINQDNYYNSHSATVNKRGQRISLNASLPFHSKLNIRIHANRNHRNENNQVQATATIQRLDRQRDYEYLDSLQRAYFEHYSTASPNESFISTSRANSPIYYDKLPRHHQISLPVSLPIDQRLFLYFRNGEVLARC